MLVGGGICDSESTLWMVDESVTCGICMVWIST